MAVDGVDNSNNNTALYTAGAAVVGGGADAAENIKKIENAKSAEELKEVFKNNAVLKETGMLDAMIADIDARGFKISKEDAKKGVQLVIDAKNEMVKEAFILSWDKNAKKFVHNADDLTKDGFEAVKKAAKSIQGKYAMIYGAIGAGVLRLGTLLCCGDKKAPEQPQNIDKEV